MCVVRCIFVTSSNNDSSSSSSSSSNSSSSSSNSDAALRLKKEELHDGAECKKKRSIVKHFGKNFERKRLENIETEEKLTFKARFINELLIKLLDLTGSGLGFVY